LKSKKSERTVPLVRQTQHLNTSLSILTSKFDLEFPQYGQTLMMYSR